MEAIDGQHRLAALKQVLAEARERVSGMDEADAENGRHSPVRLSLQLGNVAAALHAAINTRDWGCAADALVMLSQCNDKAKVVPFCTFNTFVD